MATDENSNKESRAAIIQSVKNPLNFFTLGVLVTEGLLYLLSKNAQGALLVFLNISMVSLIFLLVIIVAYFSHKNSEILAGVNKARIEGTEVASSTDDSIKQLFNLKKENEQLKAELEKLTSFRNSVWAALHQSNLVRLDDILNFVGIGPADLEERKKVIGLLGILLEEGKIERSKSNPGCFFIKERTQNY